MKLLECHRAALSLGLFTLLLFAVGQCCPAQTPPAPASTASSSSETGDRPILKHQAGKMESYGKPEAEDQPLVPSPVKATGPLIAPGLRLPATGRVWAVDQVDGRAELVHLKYSQVVIDNHTASNVLKTEAAPFIYKPKKTVEIRGTASAVRLRDPNPVFFVRGYGAGEKESERNEPSDRPEIALVRLEAKAGTRVAATIAFTQITSKASRFQSTVDATIETVPDTDWLMMKPAQPLPAGEYGIMQLPKDQNLFGSVIYDFAIDGAALKEKGAIK